MSKTYCRLGYETGDYGSGTGTTTSIGVTNISYDVKRDFVVGRSLDTTLGRKHYTTKKITGKLTLAYRPTAITYLVNSLFGTMGASMFTNVSGLPLVIDVLSASTSVRFCGAIITRLKFTIAPSKLIVVDAEFVAQRLISNTLIDTIDYTNETPLTPFNTSVEFDFDGSVKSYDFTATNIVVECGRTIDDKSYHIGTDLITGVRSSGLPTISARIDFAEHEYNVFNNLLLTYESVDYVRIFLSPATDNLYVYLEDVAVEMPKVTIDGLKVGKSVELQGYNNSGFFR